MNYIVDTTFRDLKRLFVLLFKSGDDDPARDSFDSYMSLLQIKDYNDN